MDRTIKFVIATMMILGLLIIIGSVYLSSLPPNNDNVALASTESPFTLIGTPPGTKNVLVFMFRQQSSMTYYTCFLVITQIAADISCP